MKNDEISKSNASGKERAISRRRVLKGTAAVAGATALGFPYVSRGASGELVICTFGGQTFQAHRKAYFEPFEKETGIKIIDASPTDFGKLKAMVLSGNPEWDLVDAGGRHMFAGAKLGLLEKIDYTKINTEGFLSTVVNPYGLGGFYWSTNICNSLHKPRARAPGNWKEFYDVKGIPGTRAMRNTSFDNIEQALMADGVEMKDIYPLTDEKIDRAYRKLDEIKPHVLKWWRVEAQVMQMVTDGEVDFAMGNGGRAAVLKRQGAKLEWVWNEGIVHGDSWVIPKGARNKDNSMRFLAWFASRHDRQAEFSRLIPMGPVNMKAMDYLDEKSASELCTSPENLKLQLVSDGGWWGDNYEAMEKRWHEWILS